MATKKILTYISDDTSRKRKFRRRTKGLMKKLDEIRILCGVDACSIIFNPSDPNLYAWPSNPDEVTKVLKEFEKVSELEKQHKSVNLEGFTNKIIKIGEKKSETLMNSNKERLMKELMLECFRGNMEGLVMDNNTRGDLFNYIDQYLKVLIHRRDVILSNQGESSSMDMAAPISMVGVMAPPTITESSSSSFINALQAQIFSYQRQQKVTSFSNNSLNSGQEVYIPVMSQDEFYYPHQDQDPQQEFVEEMLKLGEEIGFPWMDNNKQF